MSSVSNGGCEICGKGGQDLVQVNGLKTCMSCTFDRIAGEQYEVVLQKDLRCFDCGDYIDLKDSEIVHQYHWEDHYCSENCDGPHAYCSDCGDEVYDDFYCDRHKHLVDGCIECDKVAVYAYCEQHNNELVERLEGMSIVMIDDEGQMSVEGTEIRW